MSQALVKLGELANLPEAELKKRTPEELASYALALRQNKVSALGDGQVFVRRGPDGEVEAVQATVTLREDRNEFYGLKRSWQEKGQWKSAMTYSLTAIGYQKLNQIAGVNVITPKTLTLKDGTTVPNPFLVREKDRYGTTRTRGVWVKKVAIGPSPLGIITRTDATLYYSLDDYFLQDMVNKIDKVAECGQIKPASKITEEDRGKFIIIEWDYGLAILADPSHKEVRSLISTQIQRQKFVERIASTICERNALKKHSAIAAVVVKPENGVVKMNIVGWRRPETEKQIQETIEKIEEGDDTPEIQTRIIEVSSKELEEEEIAEAEGEVIGEETTATGEASGSSPSNEDEKQEAEPEPLFKPTDSVNQRRKALVSRFGEEAVADAIAKIPAPWDKMTREERAKALDEAYELLKGGEQ